MKLHHYMFTNNGSYVWPATVSHLAKNGQHGRLIIIHPLTTSISSLKNLVAM